VGPVTASAVVATVGDFRQFRNGAQFGAWIGLTPKQHSSGGKTRLGRITKRGDTYLRTLLIQAAKSAVLTAHRLDLARYGVSSEASREPRHDWGIVSFGLLGLAFE
jgi:transposase